MKKKITTEQELLIQIAAQGDAAAFFSMISSALREYFLKLCSCGDSIEDSAQKVYETAETLFKKLQHTHPDNFDHWIEAEFSSLFQNSNSEHEIILDKNLFVHCEKVLVETQRVLFRVASAIKSNQQKKGFPAFFARHKIVMSLAIVALLLTITSIILYGLYDFRLDMSFIKEKQDTNIQQKDSTAVIVSDTVKKADSVISSVSPNPPVQETKAPPPSPPAPKPRPRVTYTPSAASDEGSGTYQSSRISSNEQTPSSISSRSERVSQPSSYSSQSQSTENTASTSSYYSSGTSTYSSQQSTQSQSPGITEQNQP